MNTEYVWNEENDADATTNSPYSTIVKGRSGTPFMLLNKNV